MKVLSSKTVFTSRKFSVIQNTIERNGKTFTKDFIQRNPVVLVIPYEGNTIYMESQFRDALGGLSLEIVSGNMEKGFSTLENAKRELKEETGLTAETWHHLADWELSVSMDAKIHVFAATDLKKGKAHLDYDEEITLVKMSLDEVFEKIRNGEMKAASHIASLFLFKQLQEEGKL